MKTAILHYSAPPVIGGVEAVIQAHAARFAAAGLPLTVIAGRGQAAALPRGVDFISVPEMDTLHPEIAAATAILNTGQVPKDFAGLAGGLEGQLRPLLAGFDHLIVHNVLTKHFNLPLTAALFRLVKDGTVKHCVAWCHDLTWSSPNSRDQVFPAYPWELLKTPLPNTTYVTISRQRRKEMSETFGFPEQTVRIIYNGVDPQTLLGLTDEGLALIDRLGLWGADLVLLMPVRVTRAKNIEYAMKVLAALKKLDCRPKIVLTGPPDPHDPDSMVYYQSLLDLRRELGLEDAFRFVYESGPRPDAGHTIGLEVVYDLYRVADALFMPSHREGFGMPVLEAGLAGLPVICTGVPAARDLAREDALIFAHNIDPDWLARQILKRVNGSPEHRLRVRARQNYTWQAIFERDILPLLEGGQS